MKENEIGDVGAERVRGGGDTEVSRAIRYWMSVDVADRGGVLDELRARFPGTLVTLAVAKILDAVERGELVERSAGEPVNIGPATVSVTPGKTVDDIAKAFRGLPKAVAKLNDPEPDDINDRLWAAAYALAFAQKEQWPSVRADSVLAATINHESVRPQITRLLEAQLGVAK